MESSAVATEELRAEDGEVETVVRVETEAPGTEPAAVVNEAVAAAVRSVMGAVYGGDQPPAPERDPGADPPETAPPTETGGGRPMDWSPGGSGGGGG